MVPKNNEDRKDSKTTIDVSTRLTIGFVVILMSGVVSFVGAMYSMASKDYVDKKIEQEVKNLKEMHQKDQDNMKKDQDYIKTKVDEIYNFLLDKRRR